MLVLGKQKKLNGYWELETFAFFLNKESKCKQTKERQTQKRIKKIKEMSNFPKQNFIAANKRKKDFFLQTNETFCIF